MWWTNQRLAIARRSRHSRLLPLNGPQTSKPRDSLRGQGRENTGRSKGTLESRQVEIGAGLKYYSTI